jgi:head-tail adaptor
MSFGKMNTKIDIISSTPVKDADGFVISGDHIVASIRAYKEDRHGNERWANMAAFSEATALFRFRKIPSVEITTSLFIVCGDEQYRIISAEDVRGRGMYVEVLAEKQEGTVR